MKFGLRIDDNMVWLVDLETGEILAEGPYEVLLVLQAYEELFTLILI